MTSAVRELRPGLQLASTVCGVRVIVVRAPAGPAPGITCGGEPMVPLDAAPSAPGPTGEAATLIGKRYEDSEQTIELLCTSSGSGVLSCDGAPMTLKAAKALPASD
ncbi:hypothetical protein [Streptomyces endophyticus]|uniref:Uncharacterized protein n=1 Tax=Streptomyces endophyticus TaxID=714166 RepID=A0ABU6EWV6_9ACTN|nr:hypothetical protein [Streptomyces endophyticus]MEB8336236.1 hypothetical protein [Streptomyces endophyticus]